MSAAPEPATDTYGRDVRRLAAWPNRSVLGKALAAQRERHGMTQAQVVNLAGVGKSTVSYIETGRSTSVTAVEKVIHALKCDPASLLADLRQSDKANIAKQVDRAAERLGVEPQPAPLRVAPAPVTPGLSASAALAQLREIMLDAARDGSDLTQLLTLHGVFSAEAAQQ